jgi:hypothetical protein
MSTSASLSPGDIVPLQNTQVPGPLQEIRPPPAYVAQSGIAQTLADFHGQVEFSESSRSQLNNFLDWVLYNVLLNARSTGLWAVQPAVTGILHTDSFTNIAREEVNDLLGSHELSASGEQDESRQEDTIVDNDDLLRRFRSTRSRIAMYSRLGQVGDDSDDDDRTADHFSGTVSWGVAMFLTALCEAVSDSIIRTAYQIAQKRAGLITADGSPIQTSPLSKSTNITVEDNDMAQLATSTLLGQAWRDWRKAIHGAKNGSSLTTDNISLKARSQRDSMTIASSTGGDDHASFGTAHEMDDHTPTASHADDASQDDAESAHGDDVPDASYPEHVLAANIPLPMIDSQRDIDEIEVPGLARDPSDDESDGFRTPKEHFITHRRSSSDFKHSLILPYRIVRLRSRSLPTLREIATEKKESTDVVVGAAERLTKLVDKDTTEDSGSRAHQEEIYLENGAASEDVITASREPLEKGDDVASHTPQQEPGAASKDNQGLVAGAVAGASAFAAAAVSFVYGSGGEKVGDKPVPKEKEPLVDILPASAAALTFRDGSRSSIKTEVVSDDRLISNKSEQKSPADQVPEAEQSEAVDVHADERNVESAAVPRSDVGESKARAAHEEQATSIVPIADAATATNLDNTESDSDMLITRRNIEELERQKYRLSVKGNKRTEEIKAAEPRTNSPDPVVLPDSPARPESTASQQSFSLFPKTTAPGNDRNSVQSVQSHMRGRRSITTEVLDEDLRDARPQSIGLAQTADSPVAAPRSGQQTPEDQMMTKHTGAANPRRYSRLILSMDEASPSSNATHALENDLDAEDSSNRKVSPVSWEAEKPSASTETQQRASNRQSVPANGLQQQSQAPEKSTWRQSFSATLDRNGTWPSGKKSTEVVPVMPVQDHPVIQKLADKKNISKTNKDDERSNPLTSASIRGPEDFDMFVQGGDMVKYTLTPENVRGGVVSTKYIVGTPAGAPRMKLILVIVTRAGTHFAAEGQQR